jgi:GNAT superfamily N-acetyltransferase
LTALVEHDELTKKAAAVFDYSFTGQTTFLPAALPEMPNDFSIGLIVGASGTGKSTLLKQFANPLTVQWNANRSICSHFDSVDNAIERLTAVGLASVPSWCKPYDVLSTGEKFRADLARVIGHDAVIDEFTSVVDRNVAKAASKALRKWAERNNTKRIVVASCHRDIIPWLKPDWIIDTDAQAYLLNPRRCLQPEPVVVKVRRVNHAMWKLFAPHHYLTGELSHASRCFCAFVNEEPVCFSAAVTLPNGNFSNAWRASRLVTLPDYQGLGLGVRLSDWVAELHHRSGSLYFGKTTHPTLGAYRDASPRWKPTSKNRTARRDTSTKTRWKVSSRLSWSHQYIGDTGAAGEATTTTPSASRA